MKTLLILLSLLPLHILAQSELAIEDIKFYASNYDSDDKTETFAAYVLKNDPCLTVEVFNESVDRFCEIEEGMNLENNPSIYIYELHVVSQVVYFTVAAPWNEQECTLITEINDLECQATGR